MGRCTYEEALPVCWHEGGEGDGAFAYTTLEDRRLKTAERSAALAEERKPLGMSASTYRASDAFLQSQKNRDQDKNEKLSWLDWSFLLNFKIFLVFNFVYQVIYLLWINHWLINKDKYKCIVNKAEDYPIEYQPEDYEKIMNDPSAVDVSKKFTQVFTYSLFTYIALDIDLVLALWQYRKSVLDYSFRPNFKCVLCLFIYFVFFGVVELIMIVALRFTREGRVCSGQYLKDNDPRFNKDTYEYYMTYEGTFVIVVAVQEAL